MSLAGGLRRFRSELDPRVVEEVLGWNNDPELAELLARLIGHEDRKPFFDAYAEAIVARHLLSRGCAIQFEVPTPAGRRCDFAVEFDEAQMFLHVKRLDTARARSRRITVSSRLRYLERIERPYVVSVRWVEHLDDEHMQRIVTEGAAFIQQARVGDEKKVLDDDGREIGGLRIIAPGRGRFVTLTIGLPSGFVDESVRIERLLRRAYQQFMPRALNVILIATSKAEDRVDFEAALLGSHIERWDEHPPRGRRVAHGRDEDGFWSGRRFHTSQAAAWFHLARADEPPVPYVRDESDIDPSERTMLGRVFGSVSAIDR